jgi:hypothetical protein
MKNLNNFQAVTTRMAMALIEMPREEVVEENRKQQVMVGVVRK